MFVSFWKTLLCLLVFIVVVIEQSTGFVVWKHSVFLRNVMKLTSSTTNDNEDSTKSNENNGLRLGFIGCGTIASAIVTGFAKQNDIPIKSIIVSKRSESKSAILKEQFPSLVDIESDNQRIVNLSDIVFLTVLPQQTSDIVRGLDFSSSQHIIVSLVSTSNIEALAVDSGLPIEQIFKMICLPAVAYSEGVCILQPDPSSPSRVSSTSTIVQDTIKLLTPLLDTLGGVVTAANETEMSALMVPSSLMGSFYGILQNNRDWLVNQHHIAPEKASLLVSRMYYSMMQDAMRKFTVASTSPNDTGNLFDELIAEQTPGGLNEQVLGNLHQLGVFDAFNKVQDTVLSRIQGKSDGSLLPNKQP